jgi:hypothetical protein
MNLIIQTWKIKANPNCSDEVCEELIPIVQRYLVEAAEHVNIVLSRLNKIYNKEDLNGLGFDLKLEVEN